MNLPEIQRRVAYAVLVDDFGFRLSDVVPVSFMLEKKDGWVTPSLVASVQFSYLKHGASSNVIAELLDQDRELVCTATNFIGRLDDRSVIIYDLFVYEWNLSHRYL